MAERRAAVPALSTLRESLSGRVGLQAGPVSNKPFDEAYDLSQSDSDNRCGNRL